ncbi:MAG: hypothetical protein ABR603_17445, partial [Pyrinomonadaceae bacterium]
MSGRASAAGARASAPRTRRVLSACALGLALLAASSVMLRAQSGRRSAPPPIQIGKKGASAPTPTPTPLRRPTGPIAEPNSPGDAPTKVKQGGLRPPGSEAPPQTALFDLG